MFGMSLPRLLVNVAGGALGLVVSERYITSSFAPRMFLGLPTVSGPNEIGWDDITDAAAVLGGAMGANMLLSKVK